MNDYLTHCSLSGHDWVECHGGRECARCDAVELKRSVVLPEADPYVPTLQKFLIFLMSFGVVVIVVIQIYLRSFHHH